MEQLLTITQNAWRKWIKLCIPYLQVIKSDYYPIDLKIPPNEIRCLKEGACSKLKCENACKTKPWTARQVIENCLEKGTLNNKATWTKNSKQMLVRRFEMSLGLS